MFSACLACPCLVLALNTMAVEDRGSEGLMGKVVGRHTENRSPPYGMEGLPHVLVFLAHLSLCVCVLPVYL